MCATALAGCASSDPAGTAVGSPTSTPGQAFTEALNNCSDVADQAWEVIGDGGKTLTLDGADKYKGKDEASVEQLVCVLKSLNVSDAIMTEMSQTTGIMERQQGPVGPLQRQLDLPPRQRPRYHHPGSGLGGMT